MITKEITIKKHLYYNQETDNFLAVTGDGEKISGINTTFLKNNSEGFKFEINGFIVNQKGEDIFKIETMELKDSTFFIFLKRNIGHFRPEILREILVDYTEEQLIEVIENNHEKLADYKYLGAAITKKINEKWIEQKPLYSLSAPLSPFGLTDNLINRIYKYITFKKMYIQEFLDKFFENPYILTNVDLVGFKSADVIALKTGISRNSIFRIESALLYSFMTIADDKGDTAVHLKKLFEEVKELTDQKDLKLSLIKECLENLIKQEMVIELKDDYYSLKKLYDYETYILNFIQDLNKNSLKQLVDNVDDFIKQNETELSMTLADEQKNAIELINTGINAFALCGYAGTGKSTVSKIILNLFKGKNILCTAVSGIATDRIRKTTGQNAQIMHGILMGRVDVSYVDVLLIDESSMVNTEQFYHLLKKLEYKKDKIKIIFVGDKAQLPPIGPGNFFTDIIDSRLVPFIELKKIFRQSTDMILTTFAEQIRNGFVPNGYANGIYKDFQFIKQEVKDFWTKKKTATEKELAEDKKQNQKNTRGIVCDKYKASVVKDYHKNVNWFDYVYGNQIITPMRRYELGVETLNSTLQSMLADTNKCLTFGFVKFCLYDKVVQVKNRMVETFEGLNIERAKGSVLSKRKIFNGMLGMIIDVDMVEKCFYVVYPVDGIICKYTMNDISGIELGYAITIHKAQGAEFQNVYIPMNYAHFIMLNNKLLYTAITRAKKKVTLVGETGAFAYACKTNDKVKRFTTIEAMLFFNFI